MRLPLSLTALWFVALLDVCAARFTATLRATATPSPSRMVLRARDAVSPQVESRPLPTRMALHARDAAVTTCVLTGTVCGAGVAATETCTKSGGACSTTQGPASTCTLTGSPACGPTATAGQTCVTSGAACPTGDASGSSSCASGSSSVSCSDGPNGASACVTVPCGTSSGNANGPAETPKPCTKQSCEDKKLDLSLANPYVRFFLAGTEDSGDESIVLDISGCPKTKLGDAMTSLQWRRSRGSNNALTQQCSSFMLQELPGRGEMQQFAIQVADSMTYWVWHINIAAPYFQYSNPLYEVRQRFRFRCQETRTNTDSKYLGRSCLIITEALDPHSSDASKKVEQCLGVIPNSDTSVINAGLKAASCEEAAANGGQFLWHIQDVSSEFRASDNHRYKFETV